MPSRIPPQRVRDNFLSVRPRLRRGKQTAMHRVNFLELFHPLDAWNLECCKQLQLLNPPEAEWGGVDMPEDISEQRLPAVVQSGFAAINGMVLSTQSVASIEFITQSVKSPYFCHVRILTPGGQPVMLHNVIPSTLSRFTHYRDNIAHCFRGKLLPFSLSLPEPHRATTPCLPLPWPDSKTPDGFAPSDPIHLQGLPDTIW